MVDEGSFVLFSKIDPMLVAGDYRFETRQDLHATKTGTALGPGQLPVAPLDTHVRVRAPQYQLPPDQVLSTFPPAGHEGSFGSRLPQIVIKRRTLPWERLVAGHPGEPWLALVVVAEGEAELKRNLPVSECVTAGVHLDEPADVEAGNCLEVRQSALERIFPTQDEVGLLAHARQVDIHDTELMMGDDDGFLSVVIANRLPLPGHDEAGNDVPVKYLACLVNLSGQFDRLLAHAPAPKVRTLLPIVRAATTLSIAEADKLSMGTTTAGQALTSLVHGLDPAEPKAVADGTRVSPTRVVVDTPAPYDARSGWAAADVGRGAVNVYEDLARGFDRGDLDVIGPMLEPTYRFPVLIHWSFTSVGNQTFESLMNGLSSGLLGTEPGEETPGGRLPLEVVETGHVGLAHRTRRGDEVRSWYRGPLVPHPTADPTADRLPLAHAADQIRVVVPDGREDLSLAAAFEIGRLLGLSRPAMVASLMRWRQQHYQAAQRAGVFLGTGGLMAALSGLRVPLDALTGGVIGSRVAEAMCARPDEILGRPRSLVDPGRAVLPDADVNKVLATGFSIDAKLFAESPDAVLEGLRGASPRLPRTDVFGPAPRLREQLAPLLDQQFSRIAAQALGPELLARDDISGVPLDLLAASHLNDASRAPIPHGGDALDDLLTRLPADDEEVEP